MLDVKVTDPIFLIEPFVDAVLTGTYAGDLIVGGLFTTAAGIFALKIAGFNGSTWFDMNNIPAGNTVYDLLEFDGLQLTGS